LPKRVARSGGAQAIAVVDDQTATEVTVTIPVATSSGVGLFAALPAEDSVSDGGGEAADAPTERTPIFDTMVSAWFDDATAESWRCVADHGWQAVDAVADAEPVDFTPAGLPRRQPKARLLPGSVHEHGPGDGRPPNRPPAEHVRERLSGFQQGVQRGRHAAETIEPAAVDATPAPEALTPPDEPPAAVTEVADASTWTSAADDGWRAADAVADAVSDTANGTVNDAANGVAHVELTPAGLPRRQPTAHLLPGSVRSQPSGVAPTNGSAVPQPQDAGALRDRMNSFQRGVRKGRDEEPAGTAPLEHGFHW
jgi:hypothetical protein